MPTALVVAPGVVVPAHALTLRTARASGPGGQNVNKVATKVELRVDLDAVTGLDPYARARLEVIAAHRRDSAGRLLVTSQRFRHQGRNLEDAREKVRTLVARALAIPTPRHPTRVTAASRARRREEKRRAAARKRARARVRADSE